MGCCFAIVPCERYRVRGKHKGRAKQTLHPKLVQYLSSRRFRSLRNTEKLGGEYRVVCWRKRLMQTNRVDYSSQHRMPSILHLFTQWGFFSSFNASKSLQSLSCWSNWNESYIGRQRNSSFLNLSFITINNTKFIQNNWWAFWKKARSV